MKFYLCASGSKGNCFVLKDRDVSLMIDCGTTQRYLKDCFSKIDFDFQQMDALLITHDHSDHIKQLKMFKNKQVYSPISLKEVSDFKLVVPYNPFSIGHIRVMPIPLSHDAMYTVGYVFKTDAWKLVYITDTGYVSDQAKMFLKDADYWIMESNHDVEMLMQTNRPYVLKRRILSDSGHMNNEDAARLMRELLNERCKEVILAHISEEANTPLKALDVSKRTLEHCGLNLRLSAAKQFEIISGGDVDEENRYCADCSTLIME